MKPLEVISRVRAIIDDWRGVCTCNSCRAFKDQERIREAREFLYTVTIDPEPAPTPVPDVLDQTVTLYTGARVTVRQLLEYHRGQEWRLATQARTIANYQQQADPELKWLRQEVERLTKLAVDRYKEIQRLEQQKDDIAEEAARRIGELAAENANLKDQIRMLEAANESLRKDRTVRIEVTVCGADTHKNAS